MKGSKGTSRYRLVALLAGIVLLIPLGYIGLLILGDKLNERLIKRKMFRPTTATVTKKEHVVFDAKNHSYISDLGDRIEVHPGDEQWRVYYEFDNFDQIEEPERSRLMQLEKKRISEGRPRFHFNSKEWYDSVKVGDKLIVSYKPYSDGEIEVASVTKADQ